MRRVSAFLRRYLLMTLGALALLAVVGVLWNFSAPIDQWSRSSLGEHLPTVIIISGVLSLVALIWLPKWQTAHLKPQARFEAENEARRTLAQIIGGAAVLAGLVFTWENLRNRPCRLGLDTRAG